MPKDDWRKALTSKKIAGRSFKDEVAREIVHDAKIDAWIAGREAELAAERKRKKRRRRRHGR